MTEKLSVADLAAQPELFSILLRHAYRGIRVQFGLRFVLLGFMIAAIVAVPPARDRTASVLILVSYACWSVAVALWTRRGGVGPVRWMWVALVVDTLVLTASTLVAGASAEQTWTADLLVNGFFIIPMLAATQLRPAVCALVAGPAAVAYFASSVVTKSANTEPWGSIIVRTVVLVGLGLGCIALSSVQLSRVLTIAGLVQDRNALLDELLTLETRERTGLAEQLHDGALQYVLAARHDLDDAREDGDAAAFDRVDHALTESSTLLRSTVSQLHPAVLDQTGLARAVADLAQTGPGRAGLTVTVETAGWPAGRGRFDGLMYGCARELLVNVVKHAHASAVRVVLEEADGRGSLSIADDGRGIAVDLAERVTQGHIGLASMRTRVGAAGGELSVETADRGTRVRVTVPYEAG